MVLTKLGQVLFWVNLNLIHSSLLILNAGTAYGGLANPKLTFSDNVKLTVGINKISLLSVAVGLPVSSLTWIHVPYNTINSRKI